MNPTPEQKLAIEETGKNIIVSAGAGSGKTAVLSERVLKKALSGVPVDRLLILTFTKAAAAEMKDRIRKKIKKNNLKDQLNKIDNSYITTFDSFSLSLVKKYHYLLNVKKNINIIESNVLELKTKEYLDEIMEEEYGKKDAGFIKFISDMCIKDDKDIKNIILEINNKLNMKYEKKKYLEDYLDYFYNEDVLKGFILEYEEYLKDIISDINILLTKLSNVTSSEYYSKVILECNGLLNSEEYNDIKENALNIRLPNLPRGNGEDASNIKKSIVNKIGIIKDLTESDDTNSLLETINLTKPYLVSIVNIIKKLDERINYYKHENDLYDFIDISKMAIKIVKENENICEEIKNFFLEILVDEYQDTSDLQEEFISLISNNNLYMVGDVKQSIYRFRNANPDIFRNKYNNYAKENGGIKIDLLKNFRSREEVLVNINLLFDYIMDDEIGGADYIKEHEMVFGNTIYNTVGKTNQNNNFEVYSYEYDKKCGFSQDEIEAFMIADDIIKKVKNHYQIFDKDNGVLRDIKYSDFCILIDRSKTFALFKKIFLYKKIPLTIDKDDYLTDSEVFSVIKSIYKLLSLLKNKGSKKEIEYMYLSIARSFLFNYHDKDIFERIKNNDFENSNVFAKINKILVNIEDKTVSSILDEIIEDFSFYEKLRTIDNYADNLKKIEYLYSLAKTLNEMGYTYENFVSFIDNIFTSNAKIKFSVNKDDGDSVQIMTIHKSKGLEYHICYFPGLDKPFNVGELREKINYSNHYGIITPYYDEGMANPFTFELYKKAFLKDEVSEKIRLFYVAVTRAKEKMIFVLANKVKDEEYEKNGLITKSIRLSYRSFADILYSITSKIKPYMRDIDINRLHLSKDYNLVNSNNLFDGMKDTSDKIILKNYPKIEKTRKELSHFSKSSVHLVDANTKDMMDFGTKMHYYLETLDLKNPDLSFIDEYYKNKIKKFLECDLLKDIKDAKVYQEYEFTHSTMCEEAHGIIDLMLEYVDHIDIIDYKLKNIEDDAYTKQLTGYQNYITNLTNKKSNIYLYSIIDSVYKKL